MSCNPCCCWNLRSGVFSISVWSIIYTLVNMGLMGWQTYEIKYQLDKVRNAVLPMYGNFDPFSQQFPGLDGRHYETDEEKFYTGLLSIQIIQMFFDFSVFCTALCLIYGVGKSYKHMVWPWAMCTVFSALSSLCYCILWWAFNVNNYHLVLTIAELAFQFVNTYCLICVLAFYKTISHGHAALKYYSNAEKPKQIIVYDTELGDNLEQQGYEGDDNMIFQKETANVPMSGGYPNVSLFGEKRGEPQFATPSVVDYIPGGQETPIEMSQQPYAPNMEQLIPLEKARSVQGSYTQEGSSIPDLLVDVADMQIQTSLPPPSVELQEEDRKSVEKIGYTHQWIKQVAAAGTLVEIPPPSQVNAGTTVVQTVVTDKRRKEKDEKQKKPAKSTDTKPHHHRHHSETEREEKRKDKTEVESSRHQRRKSESHRSEDSRSHSDEGKSRKSRKTNGEGEKKSHHRSDKENRSDRETLKSRNTSEPSESDRKTRDKSAKKSSDLEAKKHKTPRDVKRKDKEKEDKREKSTGRSRSIDNLSISPREGPPSRAATSLTSGSGGAAPTAHNNMAAGPLMPVPQDAISIPQHIIIPTAQFTGSEPRKVQISSEITISYPGTQEYQADSGPVVHNPYVNTPGPQSTLAGSTNVLATGRRSQQDLMEVGRSGGATAL